MQLRVLDVKMALYAGAPPWNLLLFSLYALLYLANLASAQGTILPVSCDYPSFLNQWQKTTQAVVRSITPQGVFSLFQRHPVLWEMVALCAVCGLFQLYRWRSLGRTKESSRSKDVKTRPMYFGSSKEVEDPGLLKKHSTIRSFATSMATYTGVRTFYRPHSQADKLPTKPTPLPLLVFIHGLGGSLAQFTSLLTGLVNVGPSSGIDFPGCGRSRFSPKDWDAYSHEALVELLEVVIEQICEMASTNNVILIAHSMGCSIAVSLATRNASRPDTPFNIRGIIAICPKASSTREQINAYKRLLSIPSPIFELLRRWDRRGGLESPSVTRFVGKEAHEDTKKLQLRFNEQSRTEVWRRMAWGALPTIHEDGSLKGGMLGPEVWGNLSVPLFLVAGADDKVTPSSDIEVIAHAMRKGIPKQKPLAEELRTMEDETKLEFDALSTGATLNANRSYPNSVGPRRTGTKKANSSILKTSILPSPASHGLLYDLNTYRTLSGLIQDFLADHIDKRLSLGWQLQHLKESNKWDVKNLAKWQAISPVSEPIGGIFRAMKTLREVDEVHAPRFFVAKWRDRIAAVIDISHESPVYNPQGLDKGGIEYHKFPTVSKIPPTVDEVKDFIALVDRLRTSQSQDDRLIGVHCHYGFNRTGFFICCYLIERRDFSVQAALDEFAKGRPPGIRHEHFIDTLFVRYCVGLQRAPTF